MKKTFAVFLSLLLALSVSLPAYAVDYGLFPTDVEMPATIDGTSSDIDVLPPPPFPSTLNDSISTLAVDGYTPIYDGTNGAEFKYVKETYYNYSFWCGGVRYRIDDVEADNRICSFIGDASVGTSNSTRPNLTAIMDAGYFELCCNVEAGNIIAFPGNIYPTCRAGPIYGTGQWVLLESAAARYFLLKSSGAILPSTSYTSYYKDGWFYFEFKTGVSNLNICFYPSAESYASEIYGIHFALNNAVITDGDIMQVTWPSALFYLYEKPAFVLPTPDVTSGPDAGGSGVEPGLTPPTPSPTPSPTPTPGGSGGGTGGDGGGGTSTPTPTPDPGGGGSGTGGSGGGGDSGGGSGIGDALADLLRLIGDLITGLFAGAAELITSLVSGLGDMFKGLLEFTGAFGDFLTAAFSFVPPEIMTALSAGIILMVVFAIIKFIGGLF